MISEKQKKINLANQIMRCECKLEDLKSKYIMRYGYNTLKMGEDGQVHETERDDL